MSDSVQNLPVEPEDKGTRIDKYLSQELEDVKVTHTEAVRMMEILR